jgi:hypothetical protein
MNINIVADASAIGGDPWIDAFAVEIGGSLFH